MEEFLNFQKPVEYNRKYEYTDNKEQWHEDNVKKDEEYAKRMDLIEKYKDTLFRNNVLIKVLEKRDLVEDEVKEYFRLKDLDARRQISSVDDFNKWQYLNEIGYVPPGDDQKRNEIISKQRLFSGLRDLYHYKNARLTLAPGKSVVEMTNPKLTTLSKEAVDTLLVCDKNKHANIQVVNSNFIDLCLFLNSHSFNCIVSYECSPINPGNTVENGFPGTEEEIWMRTTTQLGYPYDILDGYYPLKEEVSIYMPKVMVFKKKETYEFNKIPVFISTVSTPWLKFNALPNAEEIEKKIAEKIKNVFQTGLYWGHDAIVVSPVGLKFLAPQKIAELYRDIILDKRDKFYRRYKCIQFAIDNEELKNIFTPVLHKITV